MAKPKVTSELESRCSFFLPIRGSEMYRHLSDTRTWRREDKLGDEDTGDSRFMEDIASDIIFQLFGYARGFKTSRDETGLIEICDGGPELAVTVDMDNCPYTRASLEQACQVLVNRLNAGKDFFADPPRVHNRSGNPDYNDPVKIYADFDVPKEVTASLRRRRKHRRA